MNILLLVMSLEALEEIVNLIHIKQPEEMAQAGKMEGLVEAAMAAMLEMLAYPIQPNLALMMV